MAPTRAISKAGRPNPRAGKVGVVVLLAAVIMGGGGAAGLYLVGSDTEPVRTAATAPVLRGDREFTVTVGGTLQAEHMERIRSKVHASVQIIELISEGTRITQEDVEKGTVLVKLDSSSLTDKHTQQLISVESATASHTKATEDAEIQEKQNESNIRAATLDVKFARMELESYLGTALVAETDGELDFAALAGRQELGGAALQKKRQLENEVDLAEEEVKRAGDTYEYSERLAKKKYISRNELKADELALTRKEVEFDQAELALRLFKDYELPMEAERRLADWREKQLERERVTARAKSQSAQATANLRSAEVTLRHQTEILEDLEEQIENCTIHATRPGLVVYASSIARMGRSRNPIEEGATVRERQEIIHLPDLSSAVAEVKVHESDVKRIEPGQKVVITVDAYPDLQFSGEVKRVAGLPDPLSWREVVTKFTVVIPIEGNHPELRPGMSCRAKVIVARPSDALYVPVQAVTRRGEAKVCFVATPKGSVRRVVETGVFDDKYVQIKSGLSEGERVLMNPPVLPTPEEEELDGREGEGYAEAERTDVAPRAAAGGEGSPPAGERAGLEEPAAGAEGELDLEEKGRRMQEGSEEDREEMGRRMMEKWQQMSEEEREEMKRRMRELRQQGGEEGQRPPSEGRRRGDGEKADEDM